jgi:hypothetical protein
MIFVNRPKGAIGGESTELVLTWRSLGHEVDRPGLCAEVLAGTVDPDVHALGLLRGSDVQLQEPFGGDDDKKTVLFETRPNTFG